MIKKKLFIIYTLLFGSVVAAMAGVVVQAEISSMQMLIGQQVQIKVSAIATAKDLLFSIASIISSLKGFNALS